MVNVSVHTMPFRLHVTMTKRAHFEAGHNFRSVSFDLALTAKLPSVPRTSFKALRLNVAVTYLHKVAMNLGDNNAAIVNMKKASPAQNKQ